MDIVETCTSSAPSRLRDHMITMSSLDNIPRNQKKFINFASNSLGLRGSNKGIVDEIWNHLKKERERRIAEKEKNEQIEKEKKEQLEKSIPVTKSEEKKISRDSKSQTSGDSIDIKKVRKIAKKSLKKAPKQSMKMKKLRKMIRKEMGLPDTADKQLKSILIETAKTSKNRIKLDGKIMCLGE